MTTPWRPRAAARWWSHQVVLSSVPHLPFECGIVVHGMKCPVCCSEIQNWARHNSKERRLGLLPCNYQRFDLLLNTWKVVLRHSSEPKKQPWSHNTRNVVIRCPGSVPVLQLSEFVFRIFEGRKLRPWSLLQALTLWKAETDWCSPKPWRPACWRSVAAMIEEGGRRQRVRAKGRMQSAAIWCCLLFHLLLFWSILSHQTTSTRESIKVLNITYCKAIYLAVYLILLLLIGNSFWSLQVKPPRIIGGQSKK